MFSITVIVFILLLQLSPVRLIEISPRQSSSCAFIINSIYCFGGNVTGSTENDSLYSLDLSSKQTLSLEDLNQQWNPVSPSNPDNIYFEKRSLSQAIGLPDGKQLLIQGGYNMNGTALDSQTLVYNAETNSWKKQPNYNDPSNGGDRQVYMGTVQIMSNLNSLGFYGGYQEHVELGSAYFEPNNSGNMTNFTFIDSNGIDASYIGFFYITYLNLDTFTWSIPTQYQTPSAKHSGLTGTYHPDSKKIFYLGGIFFDQNLYKSDLLHSMTYDTVSGLWTKDNITAVVYPKQRKMHTATLLPDNQTILIYGGTTDDLTPVKDFCFLMHIPTMTWYFQDIKAPILTESGARFQHSAVLVNHTSLFILFGVNNNSVQTNELLILDVTDTQSIQFTTSYSSDHEYSNSPSSSSNTSTVESTNQGLSKGAIAGIAVGCAAVGIIAVILAIVYYRKKSQKDKNEKKDVQLMEVDWDKIDSQFYKETPQSPNILSDSSTTTTAQQQDITKPDISSKKTVIVPEGKDVIYPDGQ